MMILHASRLPLIMSWTIQKGTDPATTFEELVLCAPALSRISQGPDTLSLRHGRASALATPLFAEDDVLSIFNGTKRVFAGHVKEVHRAGSGASEAHSYTLINAWDYFDRFVYHLDWPAGPTIATAFTTSRVLMNVKIVNGVATQLNTREQLIDLLNACLAQCAAEDIAAPFQVGDILVGSNIYPPIQEYTSRTFAELIRDQMRWHRDAVIWWDYAQSPSKIHITARAACAPVTLDLDSEAALASAVPYFIDAWTLRPRSDLQLGSVVFNYELTGSNQGEATFDVVQDVWPAASTGKELDAYVSTLNFRGPTVTQAIADVVVAPILANSADAAVKKAWWLDHLPAYSAADAASQFRNVEFSDVQFTPALGANLNELPANGALLAPWMEVTAQKTQVTARLTRKNYSTDEVLLDIETEIVAVTITATSAVSKTYRRITFFESGEFIPIGLAQAIHEAHAPLHWQGTITLVEEDCTQRAGLGNVINLANGHADWAAMNALVQGVEEDFDQGTTRLTFGPPSQLGEQDIVELMRVQRVSIRYTAPSQIEDGTADELDLGDTNGLENSQAGAGMREYDAAYKPDTVVDDVIVPGSLITANAATGEHKVAATGGLTYVLARKTGRHTIVAAGAGNSVDIDAASCNGHPLTVREAEVCENGRIRHIMVIASDTYD